MTQPITHPNLLIIDPNPDNMLQRQLREQYGFGVEHVSPGRSTAAVVQRLAPDVIVLNAATKEPSAGSLLAELALRHITTPVVLIEANGNIAATNLNYANIIGWISDTFTVGELASLIQTALERPLPRGELVLAKRMELVDTNRRLAGRVQELQTLVEIGKSVTSQLDLEAILRLVVEAVVDLTGADESYLLLLDELSGDLYLRAEANLGVEEPRHFRLRVTDSISGQVVQSGQPMRLSKDSSSLKIKTGLSVFALVNVPMQLAGRVIGVLGANNRHQQRAFTSDDETLLSTLADWAAIAIQNAKLIDDTRQFNRNLQLVNEISGLVSGTLDVEQIPRLLLQRTAEIVGAECGSLALIDEVHGGVVFQLAYDSNGRELKSMKNFVMPPDSGIVGLVAKSGIPVIANDPAQHPAWSPLPDQLTGFITRKIVAVPLIAEGEILGVIELLNKIEGDFVADDVQLLSLVASSTAIAIQNARQYSALKQANLALDEAQEQRLAAERWAVLGKASANLAHRINNSTALVPLAAQHTRELLGSVDTLPPEVRRDIEDNLDRIERNSLYTVELAAELLRRFRKKPAKEHNVNSLVERALELVEIPPHIRLVRSLDPSLPDIIISDMLMEVFVELLSNAVRAIGSQKGWLRVASFKVGSGQVVVQITDNGPGIAAENIDRIFDIFYSTTPNSLGFGLWWVKAFLEQNQAEITVDSNPNEQTTFTITLSRKPSPLRSSSK